MNEQQEEMCHQQRLAWLYLFLAGFLLFFTYPLALVPFGLLPAQHQIHLPAWSLLSLFSLPLIVALPGRLPRRFIVPAGLFLLFLVWSWRQQGGEVEKALAWLGFVCVPWAMALCWHALRNRSKKVALRVRWVLGLLWLWQVVLGVWALWFKLEVVGFSGNRNWQASLLAALCPWGALLLRDSVFRRLQPRLRIMAAWAGAGALTGWLMLFCASRGAWLAVIAWGILVEIRHRLPVLERRLLLIFLILLSFAPIILAPQAVIQIVEKDVRIPLWGRTAAMIADYDCSVALIAHLFGRPIPPTARWRMGVGPGRFTPFFAPYRAASTYQKRLVAAPVTIHPHNELLHLAAEIGVPATLCFFLLLLPLWQKKRPDDPVTGVADERLARFAAFIIVFHGFFDMPLVQPPGNLLAFCCLGAVWARRVQVDTRSPIQHQIRRSLAALLLLGAILYGTALTWRTLRVSFYERRAWMAEVIQRSTKNALAAYDQALRLQPHNVPLLLQAGACAEEHGDGKTAMKYLTAAAKIDPNFGHLNQQIGKAQGILGRHDVALNFFQRECQLYPANPQAFQELFTALTLAGQLSQLNPIDQQLRRIYHDRLIRDLGENGITEQTSNWLRQMNAGNDAAALAIANRLCSRLHPIFIDPLFFLLTSARPWPIEWVRLSFNPTDMAYWRSRLLLSHLAHRAATALDAARQFAEHVAPAPGTTGFQLPDPIWRNGQANALSFWIAVAALLEAKGCQPLLVCREDQPHAAVFAVDRQWLRIERNSTGTLKIRTAGNRTDLLQNGEVLKLGLLPQSLLLKNQILGLALEQGGAPKSLALTGIPLLELLDRFGLDALQQSIKSIDQLRNFVVAIPVHELYCSLSVYFPPAAASPERDKKPGRTPL